MFLSDLLLIKTPLLLILDTFVCPHPTIWIPPQNTHTHTLIWHCEEYVFQNRGVPCNYRVREGETKRQIFDLMYRGGGLWSFAGC